LFLFFTIGVNFSISFASGEDIYEILSKSENINSIYMEGTMFVTGTGNPELDVFSELKYWIKDPYFKMEMTAADTTTSVIGRPDGIYMYNPTLEVYELSGEGSSYSQQSISDMIEQMKASETLNVMGEENVNGRDTTIVQYTDSSLGVSVDSKFWIWNDRGLPVKMIVSMGVGETVMSTTMQFTSFDFSVISDEEFAV
jgi:hypothetical protein